MLDSSALSQLKDLNKQIHDATERVTGEVKGTRKRFGFVISESDKQEYLLPQSEMEKVLPGDTVQCILERSDKTDEKPIARIEKLLSTDFSYFLGKIKAKNNQLYVLPDHPQLTRWIFIPPKHRKNLNDGELVGATICQHPFKHKGRVQAQVSQIIGREEDAYIEHRFSVAKHQLPHKDWQQDELEAIRMTAEQIIDDEIASGQREDLRDHCFITIDGNNTQDLDDALHIKTLANGDYLLSVAIADVTAFVDINSPLDRLAQQQMSSIYLPGQKIPMLPDVLSSNLCSLKEHQDRLALVCNITIQPDGNILCCDYQSAVIRSQGKLNYDDVSAHIHSIDNANSDKGSNNKAENCAESIEINASESKTYSPEYSDTISAQISQLHQMSQARRNWRDTNASIMPDSPNYRLELDENGKMTGIEFHQRNIAQRLVEECMLACNNATALFLAKHSNSALFVGANGFRPEQLPGIQRLLKKHMPDFAAQHDDINQLSQYIAFQQQLLESSEINLADILKKKLKRSEWQTAKVAHYGLGFEAYTTFTSPIRKYSDVIVHRLIKRLVNNKPIKPLNEDLISRLNQLNQSVRAAQRDCELSLKCQFLKQKLGDTFTGTVSMVNHRQIGVYWPEFDIHGQIDVRSLKREYSFNQDSLTLKCDDLFFTLGQTVTVKLVAIDNEQLNLKLSLVFDKAAAETNKTDASETIDQDSTSQA